MDPFDSRSVPRDFTGSRAFFPPLTDDSAENALSEKEHDVTKQPTANTTAQTTPAHGTKSELEAVAELMSAESGPNGLDVVKVKMEGGVYSG